MEFGFSILFLLFYYVRPQDWLPGMAGVNLIKPIMGIWLLILIAGRSRSSPLEGILRTPHDWIILIYYGYVVYTAPDFSSALTGFFPLVAFYAFTVQSVNSWPRLLSYLKWWIVALVIVAILALLSLMGLDITGAEEPTARFADRLSLGTWMHANPNALGHSVVVVIPASYFLFFWRGNAVNRFVIFPLLVAIGFWCLYETESKGAFLVGGMLVAMLFVVGRPKFVQVIAVVAAITLGMSALSYLPRMAQMSDLRSNEGVQGRLLAWDAARAEMERNPTGVGWRQFIAYIDWQDPAWGWWVYDVQKSTHSSYVQIGADLGKYGLFLYMAGLWCTLHTLLAFRPRDDLEDRCRRVLFILLFANLASGWMINREYHTEYFLLIAATAALHRLRKRDELAEKALAAESNPESETEEETTGEAPLAPAENREEPELPRPVWLNPQPAPAYSAKTPEVRKQKKPLWNRFGIIDAGVCLALTWFVFWMWDYILENI